ncbi:MAG: hypothetical protein KBT88_08135 [Gammaproteobacteria bacterium]|nr:hypothetical protein [Gammaproteobacteria bacterium]MBQ0839741.1 hypothetical protein [Gammaproteobacteria bacterium]
MDERSTNLMPSTYIGRSEILADIVLIILLTALVFGLAYHPYFFGDELMAHRLAIKSDYSFTSIFQGLNGYKPRLVFNGILALLAEWQVSRLVYAALLVGYMVWINVLLYGAVRYLFNGGRVLAWLLIAVVITSRYGTMLYFDYVSGLVELLSTSLLLSMLLLSWLAWGTGFRWWYAVAALVASILCVFVHERYIAGLLAAGLAIALAECLGSAAERRILVVGWALSLGFVPLFLFALANETLGSLPMTTGAAGQRVMLGGDTLWSALTYSYNVFLGGNYGHEWFWGHYNHLQSVGKIMGFGTVACTIILLVVVVLRKELAWHSRWLVAGLLALAIALIAIASLPGPSHQAARYMFPVGILVAIAWIIMVTNVWRYVGIGLILAINIMYLLLGSYDSISSVYSSRAANSVAGSLLGVMPNGRSGLVVGNNDDFWSIGGGAAFDMGPRQGDTFSKVNLKSSVYIDPFVEGRAFDPALYDFGLAFNGFGPHRTARYRLVSVDTALVLAGISDVENLPVNTVLGSRDTWAEWQWNEQPNQIEGAVALRAGTEGWRALPVVALDGRWLVYRARAKSGARVPMRLQVNWHAKQDNRFLSAMIEVVYPNETWNSYVTLLKAPPGAGIGYVYATLHEGVQGVVELKSVELK